MKGVLGILLVSIAIMTPTLIWGMPSSRDLTNHFRFALPFYDSLRAGNFHPGWLAESNAGYGDASFRFYPPALYYLLAFARLVFGDWFAATLVTSTLLFALGGFGVFFWARSLGYERTAMWAGILYTLAPYHLNQFFQSFMLAEFAGAGQGSHWQRQGLAHGGHDQARVRPRPPPAAGGGGAFHRQQGQ